MIGVARLVVLTLQHLHAGAVVRPEAEIVGFVVAGLVGQAVGVVLVAGEPGPATLPDREQLADQQPPYLAVMLLAENMLDLAVGLGVVGTILHQVEPVGAHIERLQHLVVFGPGDEGLGLVGGADDGHLGADRHIDAFRLAVPDIDTAVSQLGVGHALDLDIDRAGGGHDAGFVARHLIGEGLALLQLDDVEIVERNTSVLDIDDRLVLIVVGRNMHGSDPFGIAGPQTWVGPGWVVRKASSSL